MRSLTKATAVVALAAAILSSAGSASAGPGDRFGAGALILVGGGLADGNSEIYSEIVRLAGGTGKARIGVITAAAVTPSEDPGAGTPDCNNSVCNGEYYSRLFESYGVAEAQWIPIDIEHVTAADDPAVVAQVNSMTGFFFGGGDQFRYVTTLMHGAAHTGSAVLSAIRAKHARGAVIAGTSAGAQIQAGTDMITGGSTHPALRDGAQEGYFEDTSKLGYLAEGGFGFLRSGLVDTHFSRRGREGRSIRLAADTAHHRVFGLDENTALKVTNPGTVLEHMTVLGQRGISVLDLRQAAVEDHHGHWRIRNVKWTYLTRGDSYRPLIWQARFAADKAEIVASPGCAVEPSDDVFYNHGLLDITVGLAENAGCDRVTGTSYEDDPVFGAAVTRGRLFRAYRAGTLTSFTDARIAIAAV